MPKLVGRDRLELLTIRDKKINQRYSELFKLNRKRSDEYLYCLLSEEFYIMPSRIREIVKGYKTKYKEGVILDEVSTTVERLFKPR